MARVGAGGSNVRIAVDVSPDLPLADIDASALRAAIAELVNNAKEASGGAATITVTARTVDLALTDCGALLGSPRPGSFLELTVADDGPGMAPQHRAKLFRELFFSTKPRQRGLGLLIVYGIMQQFHGGMQVSTAGTTGFCVRLFLPIACVAGPPFRPGEPPNVLAVHPNPLCLETMRKILEARGSRVTVATTADAALNTALSPGNSFELVVIETALPQHSGFILARKVYDHAHQTAFLFVQAHSILNNLDEDALLKRFPILRGPLNVPMFVDGVMSALAGANP
ncbi:MAG: hypothetical protein HYR84_08215 [Planctomycetes bacterium]|nr:hypothetical protein [Planctomycetota bacterium]